MSENNGKQRGKLDLGETDEPVRDGHAGETHWSQASGDGLQKEAPKQYSEIDQSASSQAPGNASMEAVGKQAFNDVTTSVDTDRGPVMDQVYNGAVTEGHRTNDGERIEERRDHKTSTSSNSP
jgi:hypothetical protein